MNRTHGAALSLALATLVACVTVGCRRPSGASDGTPATSAATASSSAVAASSTAGGLDTNGIKPGVGAGGPHPVLVPKGNAPPMPSGSSAAEREKELIALFSGRVDPQALPAAPTDGSADFDPSLRASLLSAHRFAATVTVGTSDLHGPVPEGVVARVFAGNKARLRGCYRAALNTDPSLAGTLRVRVKIAPNGEVDQVEALPLRSGETGVSKVLEGCALASTRRMVFPAADAGVTTLTFTARFANDDDTATK